nr:EOG090X0HN8 [Triops cancriformis]
MALCVAVIGKENSPLFLHCHDANQELDFQYAVHTCLDFVEEKVMNSNKSGSDLREPYLGVLYSTEEYKTYGYVTNTRVKFIIVLDASNSTLRENDIRMMFRKLHNAYGELLCNPFYIPGDPVGSK